MLGLVAAVLGIVAGVGIAVALEGVAVRVRHRSAQHRRCQVQPRTIVVSSSIGVVVTVIVGASRSTGRARGPDRGAPRIAGHRRRPPRPALGDRRDRHACWGSRSWATGCSANRTTPVSLIGGGAARDLHRDRDPAPLAARPLLGRDRAPRSRLEHAGPVGPRERDAQPTPDGGDVVGADDRPRADRHGLDPVRVAQGLVRCGAAGHAACRPAC